MAGFTLRVKFRGLCGFAPRKDGHKVWVFMLDEEKADTRPERPGMEEHFARMKFAAHLKKGASDMPPGVDALWPLSKVDVQIKDGRGNPLPENLDIDGFGPFIDSLPVLTPGIRPDTSFAWVGSLELACTKRGHPAGAGAIQPGYVGSLPLAADIKPLAARVHITSGKLIVDRHVLNEQGKLVVARYRSWKGEEKLADHLQFLAAGVSVDIPISTDTVIIETRDLTTGGPKESIELVPDSARIVIEFVNEEAIQFFKQKGVAVKTKGTRKIDRIFESFYKLSTTPPAPGDLPLPVADFFVDPAQEPAEPALSSPPCSPARFNTTT